MYYKITASAMHQSKHCQHLVHKRLVLSHTTNCLAKAYIGNLHRYSSPRPLQNNSYLLGKHHPKLAALVV